MKNKNIRNVPKLRFPGFEGEWEQKKLGELCQIEKGKQINKNILLTNGKYYVLNGGINPSGYTDKFNTESNTISINEGGSCGFVKLNTERFWSGGHNYTLLKPKCEVKYLYNYLKWREKYINSLAVGTGIPNIQKKVLQGAVSISYPLIQEQTKIGSFLATIDALISETEKELEAYREQKRGMLQKMFPKNGADVPEIRFPGFTDAWEQRKLGDIALVSTGCPFDSKDFSDDGDFLVITNGNIQDTSPVVDNSLGNHISIDDNKIKSAYLLDIGDILVTMDGTVGRTAKVIINGQILAQRVGRLKALNNSSFLYQWLNTGAFSKEMSILSHGGTIKHISLDEIRSYEAMIPQNDKEQEKIGKYFDNLDNLITLHQRELDRLLELKKGFMQKMFC